MPTDQHFFLHSSINPNYFKFFLLSIDEIKLITNKKDFNDCLDLKLIIKDGRVFLLKIQEESAFKIFGSIMGSINVEKIEQMPAFKYAQSDDMNELKFNDFYFKDTLLKDFERTDFFSRINWHEVENANNVENHIKSDYLWKLIRNINGRSCESYPSFFIVPAKVSLHLFRKSSEFRSKKRVPALSYIYKNNSGKIVTLWRSSQPLVLYEISIKTSYFNQIFSLA